MIEHEDGSVTVSAQEFKTIALFLEMKHANLRALLLDKGDAMTQDDLVAEIVQFVTLQLHEPHDQPN